ncbi:MAG: thioredoxin domain-containing protein [Polyangiaceae bacterium]|nr:thioredoxin domain-containing protein [Polyangiaceae bacterium]
MNFVAVTAIAAAVATSCGGSPQAVENEIEKSGHGVVTVVEFVDYDCRFCKDLHAAFAPLLEEQQGAVRVVLKHVPLDKHPTARRAAFASICAEAQGKGWPMHDALMKGASKADEELLDLTQHVGLDVEKFKSCMRSDAPSERIAADIDAYNAAGGDGLPMLFIQRTKLVGLQDEATLMTALRDASEAAR